MLPTAHLQPIENPLVDPVDIMLRDAELAEEERRLNNRTPYFTPVFINTERGESHTGFTRDVSRTGVGLLHRAPLELQPATVLITRSRGDTVELKMDITWCESCGDGWYVSGGGVRTARLRS